MNLSKLIVGAAVAHSILFASSVYGMGIVEFEHSVVSSDKVWELKLDKELSGNYDIRDIIKITDRTVGNEIDIDIKKNDEVTYSISSEDLVVGNTYDILVSGDGLKSAYRKSFEVTGSLVSSNGRVVGSERGMEIRAHESSGGLVYEGVYATGIVGSRYVTGSGDSEMGIRIGIDDIESVRAMIGNTIDYVEIGSTRFMFDDSGEYDVFDVDGRYVFSFYDKHEDNRVSSVYWIDKETFDENPSYLRGDESLKKYFEDSMVDFINSSREDVGLGTLSYDVMMNKVARKHSENMITDGFFDHTDADGLEVSDRVLREGYRVNVVGENLAYGQLNAMFAHENLMNSLGHRENILNNEYRYVGVGVAFSEEDVPYFTIVFYR